MADADDARRPHDAEEPANDNEPTPDEETDPDDARIQRILDGLPPLTDEQRERLALILRSHD
ncbi:hypothetical protein [Actinoallomurus sp. NPDC050550]|uniref:hypothetical protein n=1 Tax=Actinoallomurus sp. NPDC050550 TaxID=3154937 RepID=UPI003409126A